jgi:hypothetical protein
MRFLLAAMLFILAISLLLLGLAQRTIWAPPDNYSVNLIASGDQPYLIISSNELAFLPGNATVSAYGPGAVMLAAGKDLDVSAWVALSSHFQAVSSEEGTSLGVREIIGTTDFESPLGSDLWVVEEVGESFSQLTVPAGGDMAVLVASDGIEPVPSRVSISWPIVNSTVVSDTFIAVGIGMLVVAIILNLLALRKMLINRGPRRKVPRSPQAPRYRPKKTNYEIPKRGRRSASRKIALIPVSLGLVFSLSACATDPTPPAGPSPSSTEAVVEVIPPVVNQAQVRKILRDLQKVVSAADKSGDAEILKDRVSGPALAFREVHYFLMTKSPEIEPLPPISGSVISITLPASTNTWPRSFMIVTEADTGENLPQMLVMQQASPRENYKLWYNIPLLPGSEIPAVPATEVGSIPVERDSLFLRLSPAQLPTAFGDVINKGSESEFYNLFNLEGDEFYEQISGSQQEQVAKLRRARITFSHVLGNENLISLSTSDSGALVALLMTDTYVIRPTRENSAVTVEGLEQLLLGVEGSFKGVSTQYGGMLLFFVPASTAKGKITLLGATQSLLSIEVL